MDLRDQTRRLSLPSGEAEGQRGALVHAGHDLHRPKIVWASEKLPSDTLINGEIIIVGDDGRCSFNALQHSKPNGHVQFYAFDTLIHRGRNVLKLPIEERQKLLREALRKVEYPVIRPYRSM